MSNIELNNNKYHGCIYFYKEGDECVDVTGGWLGRQFNSSYTGGFYTKYATYLEYGDNRIGTLGENALGYGGFVTQNTIDLSKYDKIYMDHEIVSSYTVNGSSMGSNLVTSANKTGSYTNTSGITYLKTFSVKAPATMSRQVSEIDISSTKSNISLAVFGSAGNYSTDTIVCRLYNMWVGESFDVVTITEQNSSSVSFTLSDKVTYSKVEVIINSEIVNTFVDGFGSVLTCELGPVTQAKDECVIVATYIEDGIEHTAGIEIPRYSDKIQGLDANTVFYLRGDSYKDLSFNTKTVTNVGTSIVNNEKFYKAIQLTNATSNNCIQSVDGFDVSNTGDMTIEWWEYSLGGTNTGAGLLTNRTKTRTNYAEGILFGHSGTQLYVGNSGTTWNVSGVTHKDKVLNTWVHWALVKQGRVYKTYKNGSLHTTITATVDFAKPEQNAMTIGAWVSNSTANTKYGYNALISNFRISNIARYTGTFEPREKSFTSVCIDDFNVEDGKVLCSVSKATENETIEKIDIVFNNKVVQTYTNTLNKIEYVYEENDLVYGDNNIEVRAYYYNNDYVYESIKIVKELPLEEFEPIEDLPEISTLRDVIQRFSVIESANNAIKNNLKLILEVNGIGVEESLRLSDMVKLIGDVSISNIGINKYADSIRQILINKNVECSETDSIETLISKIDLLGSLQIITYLYDTVDNTSITGGWGLVNVAGVTPTFTQTTSGISFSAVGNTVQGSNGKYCTLNTIDMTKYKKLNVIATSSSSTGDGLGISVVETRGGYNESYFAYVNNGTTVQKSIDISDLSGNYYVQLQVGGSASNNISGTVIQLWLEG